MSNLVCLFIYLFIFVLCLVPGSATNISTNINSIPMLNGTNFKSWKENVLIVHGVMDLDLALRVNQPDPLTHESTSDQKREMEKWERSNRMSLMIMKHTIPEAFQGTMSEQITTAKGFLKDIEKRFAKKEKVETSTLLAKTYLNKVCRKRKHKGVHYGNVTHCFKIESAQVGVI